MSIFDQVDLLLRFAEVSDHVMTQAPLPSAWGAAVPRAMPTTARQATAYQRAIALIRMIETIS